MITLEKLLDTVGAYNHRADRNLIRLAYEFADEAHRGQTRKNGEPYIAHCLGTAYQLAKVQMDDATVIAGLLHDVSDETPVEIGEIEKNFGAEVAQLVEGVEKLGKLKYRGMERYAENLRKMFVSIASDIRIIIIKFADRIHNLQTLTALPQSKQQRISHEVLEIYAPIADRLGIGYMKGELEDLAFKHVYPQEHAQLSSLVAPQLQEKDAYLERVRVSASGHLSSAGIPSIVIEARVKHLYSIFRKMRKKEKMSLDGIYDLVALRIIVPTIADCYAALGILHQQWKPLPGRFKDYIASPKPNNYRSLHTTVFCEEGEIVEFQIRTQAMDFESRYGIAAHWNYDESGKTSQTLTQNLDWLQELLKMQASSGDHEEYLQSLRLDIFQNRIFVFTPKGDVINLPESSTPIDFAYHIHSEIGRRCSGVRINDALASLDSELHSGDVIEILTEKNRKKPSPDWLSFTRTHMAKVRIKAQLRES